MVVLHEVSGRVFERLLEFMYTGSSDVPLEDVDNVLKQAQTLHVRGLDSIAEKIAGYKRFPPLPPAQQQQQHNQQHVQQQLPLAVPEPANKKRKKQQNVSGNSLETEASTASMASSNGVKAGANSPIGLMPGLLQAAEAILGTNAAANNSSSRAAVKRPSSETVSSAANNSSSHKSRKGQPKKLRTHSPEPGSLVIDEQRSQEEEEKAASSAASAPSTNGGLPASRSGKGSFLDSLLSHRIRNGNDAAAAANITNGTSAAPAPVPIPVSAAAALPPTTMSSQLVAAATMAAAGGPVPNSVEAYMELLKQQAQGKQPKDMLAATAALAAGGAGALDINERIRAHFLSSTLPQQAASNWMQMNQTAAAAAAGGAAPPQDMSIGGAVGEVVDDDDEEEEELVHEEDMDEEELHMDVEGEGTGSSVGDAFTPPPPRNGASAGGRRYSGRPASASIARDGKCKRCA